MRKLKEKIMLVWLTALIAIGLFSSLLPQASAALNGDNFVTEITFPSGWFAHSVAVNSQGHIFVGANNTVWRSQDNGQTWTKVLDTGVYTANKPYLLHIDSNDYIYANLWESGNNYDTYRSTDGGDTWQVVINDAPHMWHMTEHSNGTLYLNTYDSVVGEYRDFIYKSTDNGATWTVWYNITDIKHIHDVQINPYNSSQIYITTGDAESEQTIRFHDGTGWTTLTTGWTAVPIWFDSSYVYFGGDAEYEVYRIPHGGTWSQKQRVFDLDAHRDSSNFVFSGVAIGDIMLFGTEDGQLWGSWDGERWVKLFDSGDSGRVFSITRKRPIYFVDDRGATEDTTPKLYRLDITKEDLIRLYYSKYNAERGSVTNAETYVLEQRLWNGTNYIDLTSVALSNVQASIKGLSRRNYVLPQSKIANAGWEWGNTTGWDVTTGAGSRGTASVVSEDKANGTYSLKYEKGASDTLDGLFRPYDGGWIVTTLNRGEVFLVSFYVKGNVSSSNRIRVSFVNVTSGSPVKNQDFDLTTSWQRITAYYHPKTTGTPPTYVDSVDIRVQFLLLKGITYKAYFDSFLQQKLEVGIAYENGDTEDAIHYIEQHSPFSFFTSDQNTLNPTITIGSQQISYSGTLTNGTESNPQNLSGILTGAVKVEANISGSGQAILKLNGTRILYEDSMILQGRTSGVYYGRYYGTFTPTITSTDLVAVTNLASNITSLSYASDKLTVTIDAPSGTTSTTKIYCTGRGKPTSVKGASNWNYNGTSKILTIIVTHSSPTTITIDWSAASTGSSSLEFSLNLEEFTYQLVYIVIVLGVLLILLRLVTK